MPESQSKRMIVVSGATGRQGGAVTRHLLDRGFGVRALTRKPNSAAARALAGRGAQVVEGNLNARESLDRALAGAYGAFSVQNFYETGYNGEIRQGKTFADAAYAAGVAHLVYSSVGGAERDTGIQHFDSKWLIEEYVRSLGVPATVLRPVFFMDNWLRSTDALLGGQLPQPLSRDTVLQQIAVDDIGAFAALAFSKPNAWIGRAVELAGDELTMTQLAATFGRALGREVAYVQVPWGAFEQQAGEDITVMYRWFESHGYKADIAALRRIYPPLATIESFLRTQPWARSERGTARSTADKPVA